MVYSMGTDAIKTNEVLRFIIANSLITKAQLEIISTRLAGQRPSNRSKGAYYRLLAQSRTKIRGIIFSVLLLEMVGLLDQQSKEVLGRLARQVAMAQRSDIDERTARDVILLIEELVKRVSRL
ncbi:MAG: hypothetical protein QXU32_01415 [Nitrososphaerales archaeon]